MRRGGTGTGKGDEDDRKKRTRGENLADVIDIMMLMTA